MVILVVVVVILAVGGCALLTYLGGMTFSGIHYSARYVNIYIVCTNCGKGSGYNGGQYEWSFHWATGDRGTNIEGNGSRSEKIELEKDECGMFSLSGMKDGDNGTLVVHLAYTSFKDDDTLTGRLDMTFLSVKTPCVKD